MKVLGNRIIHIRWTWKKCWILRKKNSSHKSFFIEYNEKKDDQSQNIFFNATISFKFSLSFIFHIFGHLSNLDNHSKIIYDQIFQVVGISQFVSVLSSNYQASVNLIGFLIRKQLIFSRRQLSMGEAWACVLFSSNLSLQRQENSFVK